MRVLGLQSAGGELGPDPGGLWYQWHPERSDVSETALKYPYL